MKTTKNRKNLLIHIVLIAGIAVTVFPFLWMIFTSFKTLPESMQIPPTILPEKIIWDSYKYVFDVLPFAQIYVNTIIITVLTVLFQVAFCTMAAYGFARIEFPFKNAIFIVLLAILMVPGQIFLIPQYLIIQNLGLVNTLPGLFLPNLFSAFGTFLLRQFFMSLPKELEEAALLDGCNRFQIFGKIMLPLVKPGIVALVIFTAICMERLYVAVNCQHRFSEDDTCSGIVTFERTVFDKLSGSNGRSSYGSTPTCNCFHYFPETVHRRCCTVRYQGLNLKM